MLAIAAGFVKQASGKDIVSIGLGALGAGLGTAGLVTAVKSRRDMKAMREQSRAADALHSAMLYEARTGRRIPDSMRRQIGTGYMAADKAYRDRFSRS